MGSGVITLFDTLAAARDRLISAGIAPAEAAVDVDLYARAILGWDRLRVLTRHNEPAPEALEPRFSEWIARRERREPSAYIVGAREFWALEFLVTPAVLIPRPETEFVVEEALRATAGMADAPLRLADIGTGCGCIAVSLAHELRNASVIASDVSADALAVARRNAVRHGVDRRVLFVQTSYLDGLRGTFDLIAANPPYVKQGDKPALSRDVQHEPDVALFGGASGLRDISGVLDTAIERLRPGGWFVMEFGFGQEDDVRALVSQRPALRFDRVREDLQGLPRTAVIQRA
jgi:release factor glutamine methyltransferase